jgi:xylulokinase
VPVPAFTITKLAWLAAHEPDVWSQLRHVLLPHDYLTFRLTGQYVTDRGDASGTGYWSPFGERWVPELLCETVGPAPHGEWLDALPEVLGPTDAAGDVDTAALGMRGRAICGPGTGDNMAAALGVGLRPGDVAISLGTSGTVYSVAAEPTADPSGHVAGFADATGHFLPLVCTLNATLVTDAITRLVGVDHDGLDALALSCPPGADGVVVVPYFAGERTPNRPDATGLIAGLRPDVTQAQVARAAFEGVVCGLLDGLDALRAADVTVDDGRLFLVGGGSHSRAYRQIVADLTGRSVTIPDGVDHVATGACVQAAAVMTSASVHDVCDAWGLGHGTTVEPDPRIDAAGVRATYAAARDR